MTIYDSILNTVKTGIGYAEDYTPFDGELILYINSALRYANQLGIGLRGYIVSSKENTWDEFITENDINKFSEITIYIILQVKLLHDPPPNSFLVESIKKTINELEWRLNVDAEFCC